MAAAFNAPIGGILFTLEEASTYWSQRITFNAFIGALMAQLIFSLLSNISEQNLSFSPKLGLNAGTGGAFEFGAFEDRGFFVYELPLFALIGCIGGCLGALFNHINGKVTKFRIAYVNHNKFYRLCDLLFITILWTSISFIIPVLSNECYPVPTQTSNWSAESLSVLNNLVQLNCEEHHFSPAASLYLTDANTAIQSLFHFLQVDGSPYISFTSASLVLFFIPFFLFAAITAGTFTPAGLFVPTLLAGAAYGRLIGEIMNGRTPGKSRCESNPYGEYM